MIAQTIISVAMYLEWALFVVIGIAGLVGAGIAASTREDAFPAADRQPKWVWVAILVASTLAVITHIPFLSWIGMVVIGVYWFDVRPQLQALVRGDFRWD